MEETKDKYSFKILNADPSAEDLSENKVHTYLAEQIIDVVKRDDCPSLISLEGEWGSGKSSVVELIKAQTNASRLFNVIHINSWNARGVALRRRFLKDLFEQTVLQKGEFSKRFVESLSKPYSVIKTKSQWSAFSIAMWVAIGFFTVGLSFIETEGYLFGIDLIKIGTFLTFLPLCVLLCGMGWKGLKELSFLGQPEQITETINLNESDEDLEESYEKITNKIIGKVLVVVDDLDRLEPEEFKEVWADLKLFTESNISSDKVVFLVPFDKNKILLKRNNEQRKEDEVDGFIEKNFSIQFNLPPMIHVGWREFLKRQVDVAFDGWVEKEKIKSLLCGLFLNGISKDEEIAPTYRQVKLVINKLGITYSNHFSVLNDDITLEAIVAFSYLTSFKKETAKSFRINFLKYKPIFRYEVYEGLPGGFKDLIADLFGLFLNVSVKDSVSYLLRNDFGFIFQISNKSEPNKKIIDFYYSCGKEKWFWQEVNVKVDDIQSIDVLTKISQSLKEIVDRKELNDLYNRLIPKLKSDNTEFNFSLPDEYDYSDLLSFVFDVLEDRSLGIKLSNKLLKGFEEKINLSNEIQFNSCVKILKSSFENVINHIDVDDLQPLEWDSDIWKKFVELFKKTSHDMYGLHKLLRLSEPVLTELNSKYSSNDASLIRFIRNGGRESFSELIDNYRIRLKVDKEKEIIRVVNTFWHLINEIIYVATSEPNTIKSLKLIIDDFKGKSSFEMEPLRQVNTETCYFSAIVYLDEMFVQKSNVNTIYPQEVFDKFCEFWNKPSNENVRSLKAIVLNIGVFKLPAVFDNEEIALVKAFWEEIKDDGRFKGYHKGNWSTQP